MAKTAFRRIRGRIVPIKTPNTIDDPTDPGATVKAAVKLKRTPKPELKPNRLLQVGGLALAAGGGILGGMGGGSTQRFIATQVGSLGLGLAGEIASINAYNRSRGSSKQKQRAIVRATAINQVVGWGAFGATLAAQPGARAAAAEYGTAAFTRAVGFIRSNPGILKRFLK